MDERTDVWAVGATMFVLLSGTVFHEGQSAQHVTIKAATEPARSLRTVAPDVPPEIVAVVDRALMFEQAARWPSADAMREALGEVSSALFGEESPTIRRADAPALVFGHASTGPASGDR